MDPFADEPSEPGRGFDLHQLVRAFWRRRLLFFIPFAVCLGGVLAAVNLMTPQYLSSGQLRVVYEATPASALPRDMGRGSSREMDQEALINIETILTGPTFLVRIASEWQQQLMGGAVSAAVVDSADTPGGDALERAGARIGRKLRITEDGPHLFSIGVRDPDPVRAYHLARLVLDRFLEEERASRLRPSTSTRDFLQNQRDALRKQVEAAEDRLTEYQQTIVSASLAGNPVNEGNISVYETVMARLRSEVNDTDSAEMLTLERQARGILPHLPATSDLVRASEISGITRELADLEYDDALGVLDPDRSGDRVDRMGNLRLRLNRAVEDEVARRYPNLGRMERVQVAAYLYQRVYREVRRGVLARLQRDLQEYRDFVRRQPEQSAQLTRLREEAERARGQLLEIERSIAQENMRIEASLSEIGYKMVVRDNPHVPVVPVEPDRQRLTFLGLLLAMFSGVGLVVLAEMTDRSFRSVPQIEKDLGVPVVGTLPVVAGPLGARSRGRWRWVWAAALGVLVLLVAMLVLGPRSG